MVYQIMNLPYQEDVYSVKIHLYWLENVINFMDVSQKNTSSSFSVLQPKALHFRYLILKVPCFLQFFWLTANDNYYFAGSIPSPLLSGSCEEDGFADIPTHIRSIITNDSSSTGSYYCFAIFRHDLMCSIYENHCDMRQHRKGMN